MSRRNGHSLKGFLKLGTVFLVVSFILGLTLSAWGTDEKPIKIGIVTFLSGPAAGPFGVPARNGAEVIVETLNAGGKLPAPYAAKGFGGSPLELVFIDEAGGATKQVTEYRNLVQRQNVDLVIGYISSGDAIAIPPV
ncbi:MAG TPA: ABC transporter substrate-binding protein, partial [Thermodesulfobacteriota bacterium]|nr:ABC transporter substrate-binding protein [Thermodesulfobacteriota bacterium]